MKQDADAHAEEDKNRRALVDLKNQGDAMVYNVRKTLNEAGEKVDASERSNIESAASALEEALKGDDAEAIQRTLQTLEQASHKLAEAMYKSTAGAQAAPGPQPDAADAGEDEKKKGDDDVIDAEYEVNE